MNADLERRQEFADELLEVVAGRPGETVALVSEALVLGGGPLAAVGEVLQSWVEGSVDLARLKLGYELRRLARDEQLGEQLEGTSEPLWRELQEALQQVRAAASGSA